MDISQFSRCLKELIEENDKIEVPHLGTFCANYVPASFSDKHTTINPPTREMSFVRRDIEPSPGNVFVAKMMQTLGLSEQQAAVELGWCLSRIISELEGARVCILPGLGKMKANAKKDFFFIPDDDLDIFPEGLGFDPINIKAFATESGTKAPDFVPETAKNHKSGTKTPDSVPAAAKNPKVLKVLTVAVVVVAIMLAVYLLRDTPFVSSLLDNLLYTKEELQLLGR